MKKIIILFSALLFFLCNIISINIIFKKNNNLCFAKSAKIVKNTENSLININNYKKNSKNNNINKENEKIYIIELNNRKFKFSSQIKDLKNQSKIQNKMQNNIEKSCEILKNMGFSKREIIDYLCPEIKDIIKKLKNISNKNEEKGKVFLEKNKCKISINNGKPGSYLNEEKFYNDIFNNINKEKIEIKATINKYKNENLKNKFNEKSCFSTNFQNSSISRKNNIKVALSMFDGITLEEGEILSFNKTTGLRNEKSGYQKAKIISLGTFVEGFGGGVCQVSTTLYNACLLAGLEILEVNSHSLPVSYVEPSFDAMVNVGSSDLIIQNNSGGKIIITTSSENDIAKVKIFGLKNKYKITRFSEKTKIINAEPDKIETDLSKYGDIELNDGETKRLSYSKDGFYSNGYLKFYDKNGILVETKLIRKNRYNPTKGIILKKEEKSQ